MINASQSIVSGKVIAPTSQGVGALVGVSKSIGRVRSAMLKYAGSSGTVLIGGETGTGKDLAARAIHAHSTRSRETFKIVDCGAVSPTLIESELFGHVRGAFTGADRDRAGAFEMADMGTLFFDEIGELPLEVQPRLLRALETREVRRVGGSATTNVNVRVIAATNRDLAEAVRTGAFRDDLFYRLNVLAIHMPPLRDRPEDIEPLCLHFLRAMASEIGDMRLGQDALESLRSHSWPGNIREMKNVLYRAAVVAEGGVIKAGDLALGPAAPSVELSPPVRALPRGKRDHSVIKAELEEALDLCGDNRTLAAKILGCDRNTVRNRINRFGLKR